MIRPAVAAIGRWSRPVRITIVAALVLFAVLLPQLGSTFAVSLGLSILTYGLLAMSLDLIAGYTGLISLGHASFLGVGAYGIAYGLKLGLDPTASIAFGLLVVLVVALLFGLIAVRVRELTFVILTLALGQIVWGLAFRWVSVSGGDNGLSVSGRPGLGPFDLTDSAAYYEFALAVFIVCAALMWMIVRSPFGLSLRGIRDNEARMRTLGYNVALHKYLAFVISGLFGGVAGVLFAFTNLYVSPTMIDFAHNGAVVQMVIVGGMGTLWGPLVGAAVIVLLQQFVSIYVQRWVTGLGILFVLVVLFARTGLWGGTVTLGRWLARRAGAAGADAPRVHDLGEVAAEGGE